MAICQNEQNFGQVCVHFGCITLDAKRDEFVRRTLFTLPAGTDENTLNEIVSRLEKKSFRVVEIDDLQSGQPIRIDEDL